MRGYAFLMMAASLLSAQQNQVEITKLGDQTIIRSNGVPSEHGTFPNRNNPHAISAQNYTFVIPVPQMQSVVTDVTNEMLVGVAIDGVPFDPGTAEYWQNNPRTGLNYEAMSGYIDLGTDSNHAHVQPTGAYHYHGVPEYLVKKDASGHSVLIGYAADGFPIYARYGQNGQVMKGSYQIKSGQRDEGPTGVYTGEFVQDYIYVENISELDECNGMFGPTPEFQSGIYHYFITDTFPFVPRCLKGEVHASFKKKMSGGGGARKPRQNEPTMHQHPGRGHRRH